MNRKDDVPIEVTSRHEALSERMRDYIHEKAGKLVRFHDRISRIQVVVDGAHANPEVEMILHVDSGATLVAKERQEHFRAAVDLLVDKMERQLKKDKERLKDHKAETLRGVMPNDPSTPGEELESYEDVVRKDLLP